MELTQDTNVGKRGYYTRRENGYWKDAGWVTIRDESEKRYKIYFKGRTIWVAKRNVTDIENKC